MLALSARRFHSVLLSNLSDLINSSRPSKLGGLDASKCAIAMLFYCAFRGSIFNIKHFFMTNSADFIAAIYDNLTKIVNLESSSQSMFMQMAWPGYALSPADFKLEGQPDGAYDSDVAREVFSDIANITPTFNKTKFENSGYEIDDLYEILLTSAIPVGATQDSLETNPINRLFSDAQFELLQARRGSKSNPNVFYYPCGATPSNWYDPAAAQSWPTLNIKSTDIKPVLKPTPIRDKPVPIFDREGAQLLRDEGLWKLRSDRINSTDVKSILQQTVNRKAVKQVRRFKAVEDSSVRALRGMGSPVVRTKSLDANVAIAARSAIGSARNLSRSRVADVRLTRSPEFSNTLMKARNADVFKTKSLPVNIVSKEAFKANVKNITIDQQKLEVKTSKKINVSEKFVIRDLINEQLPTKPSSTATNGYRLSFKYCRVNIDRDWFKLALLSTKNWYMFNTAAQEYSTGNADDNPGMFPLLPVSFIVIRDLKITANWSQEDKRTLGQAVSFGPFDIRQRTLRQNTLEVKGLQIIAWISRLMPPLPPTQT